MKHDPNRLLEAQPAFTQPVVTFACVWLRPPSPGERIPFHGCLKLQRVNGRLAQPGGLAIVSAAEPRSPFSRKLFHFCLVDPRRAVLQKQGLWLEDVAKPDPEQRLNAFLIRQILIAWGSSGKTKDSHATGTAFRVARPRFWDKRVACCRWDH